MRSFGGVSITLISRKPTIDMCRVRGIGVADMVSTSTCFAHLLDALFMTDAEALFFIDDQQPEVGELHVFRKQSVSADQNVDLARFQLLQDFLLLFRRAEAADHLNRAREMPQIAA